MGQRKYRQYRSTGGLGHIGRSYGADTRADVIDVDMPMGSLVKLMTKCAIAAIPGILLLLMLWGAVAALVLGVSSAWTRGLRG